MWAISSMIFLEGMRIQGFCGGLLVAFIMLGSSCAKSQPDSMNTTHSVDSEIIDTGPMLEWELEFNYMDLPDTTRMQFGYFALVNVEGELYNSLIARHTGDWFTLVDTSDHLCLSIVSENDFDGNGLKDLLVSVNLACKGESMGNAYFIVAHEVNGDFTKTQMVGYDFGDPEVMEWKGKWSVLISSDVNGQGKYGKEKKKERYVLANGKMELVETIPPQELQALAEIRTQDFDSLGNDATLTLEFDLDRDGLKDRITAHHWKKYDRVLWSIRFGNGKEMLDGTPAMRLGVLPSTIENYHELVVDHGRVLEWTGKRYEERRD
jgi:hypothetical protein